LIPLDWSIVVGSHSHANNLEDENTRLKPSSKLLGIGLMVGGLVALGAAYASSLGTEQHGSRFLWALLFGVSGFLAISCSALIFVLINHLVRAGWITNVRRILETLAMQIPLMALLLLPIIIVSGLTMTTDHDGHARPLVYSWAVPANTPVVHHGAHDTSHEAGEADHAPKASTDVDAEYMPNVSQAKRDNQVMPGIDRPFDELIEGKYKMWLSPKFWAVRIVAYLAILSVIGWYFFKKSVEQDTSGDVDISSRLSAVSPPALIASALLVTFIGFDVFMSLDPHWFSTMFGVYYFASGTQAMWACMILFCLVLQRLGYLNISVSKEHFHDMGKFMFAFVVFFAYIAFSQYMLQWYANMPEETFWYDKRGYSTMYPNGYTPFVLILLIGRFVIPFLGLISRHVKRNYFGVGFWAIWLLGCTVVDMYLIVIPEFSREPLLGLPEILCLAGAGLLWTGNSVRMLASHALRPVRDPRVHESVALQNF
jgi:lipid-A-disaccharide synthase-like uncharacterized protein